MEKKKRRNASDVKQAEVMFKSNRECVVCNKRGDQIHHLDGDVANNDIDNLALLCFDCHSEATIKGGLRKKLSAKTIIKFRELKYRTVAVQRQNALKVFSSPIRHLHTDDLLNASITALTILEIAKLREEYFTLDWDKRSDILYKLHKFEAHTNFRIAYEVFNLLSLIAYQTRSRMPSEVASEILALVITFFPRAEKPAEKKKVIELNSQCVEIGYSLIYDALIYLGDYKIAMYGLTILKFINKEGKRTKSKELIQKVAQTYEMLEHTLHRPERTDLGLALELLQTFKVDKEEGSLAFPPLSKNLMNAVYPD